MKITMIEMPTKLTNNFLTIQFLAQMNETINSLSDEVLKLSFKKTYFIQPTMVAILGFLMDLAKSKNNQVVLVSVKEQVRILLENYELFKNKNQLSLANRIPFRIFKCPNEKKLIAYLDASLKKMNHFKQLSYIYAYLTSIFNILEPIVACNGYYNLSEDWLFFTIVSSATPELDAFSLHLIVEELQMTAGKLWVTQANSYYDLKETKTLSYKFSGTLFIIGFPLGTLS